MDGVRHHQNCENKHCRLCWLFHNSFKYHKHWGGTRPKTDFKVLKRQYKGIFRPREVERSECVHLGKATGEKKLCETCKGKVMLKVFKCSHPDEVKRNLHPLTTMKDCSTCKDHEVKK